MSYTPLGPPTPEPGPTEPPSASGRSLRPFLLGAAVGAGVLLAGIGVGFVVWGEDDDAAPVAAADADAEAPTDEEDEPSAGDEGDPSDPFGGDLSDMFGEDFSDLFGEDFSDMFGGDLSDFLPDDFGDFEDMFSDGFEIGEIQAILIFEPDATERQLDRIDQAWRDSDVLSSVLRLDADSLPSVPGMPDGALPTSVSAFAEEQDAEAVREFVCSFTDDPGVQAVHLTGPGTRPCDQSL